MACDRKLLLLLLLISVCVEVKADRRGPFLSVNHGDFEYRNVEYGATFQRAPLSSSDNEIFHLVLFNTTPNAYTLAIVMGVRFKSIMRVVWTANRNHPVSDNATLEFTTTGNLVLSDADGTLVWSTNTSNKGAVQIELGADGNLVMYDKKNETVWQSFDYPSDTLMIGQSLKIAKVKKLVSRISEKNGAEGPYSLVMEAGGFALYASFPRPVPYWTVSYFDVDRNKLLDPTHTCKQPLGSITFVSEQNGLLFDGFHQLLEMSLANLTAPRKWRSSQLCDITPYESWRFGLNAFKIDPALSFLRLDWDGNLRAYTFTASTDGNMWDITYERFDCKAGPVDGCGPPRKCGSFGLCEDGNCVACPHPDGLKGWSNKCAPPQLPTCKTSNASLDFYKVVGAEHFSNKYVAGIGKIKVGECRSRCLRDCKCAAFFYWEESSTCFLTQTLDTLQQLGNTTHLAFIKYVTRV
ncbi:hypothetical protein KI387_022773 [Taxus chinensis]|uniref:Uncharacterized protein n=1 Tax=Taxus chinensis TaxID=29808 RepID=A0AA38G1K4_TAXCH|nr:hypothetical protein KI387_022773 [Taxus chinensis]